MRRKYASMFRRRLAARQYYGLLRSVLKYPAFLVSRFTGLTLATPILGCIAVTYRCNARCRMCDFPSRAGRAEYGTDRMKAVIDDLGALGIDNIAFTGGEPMLRGDIFDLIEHAKSRGALTQMATNALLLDAASAERLVATGLDALTISIDGATADVHDGIRGVPGAFDRAVAAAGHVLAARKKLGGGLLLSLSAVIVPANVHQLPEIVALARRLGADNVSFFSAEGAAGDGELFAAAEREAIVGSLRRFLRRGEEFRIVDNSDACLRLLAGKYRGEKPRIRCLAGYASIFVDCYGDVFPCYMALNRGTPIASLETTALQELWESRRYREVRRKLLDCHDCHYVCHLEINTMFAPLLLARTLLRHGD
ncbi:MAG: radical SAM protein [Candidatus Aureabacteria bacterium]|jgi:MoaA/NifB/PqqE/SkfB family radical SAM enzyme|nr:radical SAM protein [Candidatus Auribacterota bacterium]